MIIALKDFLRNCTSGGYHTVNCLIDSSRDIFILFSILGTTDMEQEISDNTQYQIWETDGTQSLNYVCG